MSDLPGPPPAGGDVSPPPHAPAAPPAPPPALAQPGPPSGTTWGGPPVEPPKPRGPRSTSGRTAAIVLGIIVGVVAGVNVVNAALPLPEDPVLVDPGPGIPVEPLPSQEPLPVEPGPVEAGDPLDVGAGFRLTTPSGWTVVGGEDGLTVLQKGGALLIVGGFSWPGTPTELAQLYAEGWFSGGQFTSDEPQTGVIGNGIPAAIISYTGVAGGSAIDGAIVAAVVDASGLVVNVFGAPGSLDGVSADIDLMLSTVTHSGG